MIQIFTTGGTIDKTYNPYTGELIFSRSYIVQMLECMNYTAPYTIKPLMQKDSLDMTDADRIVIRQACEDIPTQRIVITHGTDTMVDTAQVLTAIEHKTIILTGAMIPYSISGSDAMLNFGFALGVVNTLADGVYIAMNGQVFLDNNVIKDRKRGIFVARHSS